MARPFALNLACPILDDFQGWGFRPAIDYVLWDLLRQAHSIEAFGAHQDPRPSKTEGWGTQTSKPSATSGPPAQDRHEENLVRRRGWLGLTRVATRMTGEVSAAGVSGCKRRPGAERDTLYVSLPASSEQRVAEQTGAGGKADSQNLGPVFPLRVVVECGAWTVGNELARIAE